MKTANLAIVFTDIKGFTERTSRQTLEQNQRLLDVHAKLLTPLFAAFGGRIVKSIGDAFMVTFESPTQAVLCGVAIQDRLWLHNRTAPEAERLDVRIAINVGEVRIENRDVFGEPVNIAARVEGIAEAGEVYFTEAVYLAMNKAEVPSQPVGDFELKGIPGTIKVFRVPRAPYRVEAPQADGTGASPVAESAELPPFGNLGLSRVRHEPVLTLAAGKLGAAVNTLASRTRDAARGRLALRRLAVPAGAVAALVAIAAIVSSAMKNEVERAIDEVRAAGRAARFDQVEKAEALIARVEDPRKRLWYAGQLDEAREDYGSAVERYREAAKKGSSDAEERVVDLLSSPACPARSAAARVAGEMKLSAAKSALEDLAEKGGPGEGSGGILGLGRCDSRRAAREALRRLE
ncbi:MAG: adenylate/guanylate cyclase domain-containing protein [Myxococcaceae bacterium]|nr:adenylate/guanylate cyclase domain-containing protein [Myxococcaceae bacterium]